MTTTVRQAVHNVLTNVDSDRYDLATALDRARQNLKDPRDRALLGEITLGVYRSRRALDHIISQLSSRTFSSIDNKVVRILRAALYQLVHLDRIPAHAIVADAVSLTRTVRVSSASGFVNAVLRNYTEQRRPITYPPVPSSDPDTDFDRVGGSQRQRGPGSTTFAPRLRSDPCWTESRKPHSRQHSDTQESTPWLLGSRNAASSSRKEH